jgi:hypothetical protein
MEPEQDIQEIQKRLQMLEEENARLRNIVKPGSVHELKVIEGEYKGHPTLSFAGPFRPFVLGLSKLRVLKEAWPQIEDFLRRHVKTGPRSESDDDDKI